MKLTYSERIAEIRARQRAQAEVAETTLLVRSMCAAAATAIIYSALIWWAAH